ncbi:MAG: hypothetical protein ACR2IE_07935 [Candidatus Sumerlaeaceae bacterium]
MKRAFCVASLLLLGSTPLFGYPDFQEFSQEHSGRRVDCAMCHISPTGPSGTGLGQISSLSEAEKELLDIAREAKPGQEVKNPLLNAFGNHMVKLLGAEKIMEITTEPERLASLYGFKSDLDSDGLADAQEYLDGTDPMNSQSGRPATLFVTNLRRNWLALTVSAVAAVLILFGIRSLLAYYSLRKDLS